MKSPRARSTISAFGEIFRERADERQGVVEELREEVRRLGGDPEDTAPSSARLTSAFEDLKAAITGGDEKSIIDEVERGEDYLKEKFETALNSDTLNGDSAPSSSNAINPSESGHDQMSQLKHGMETRR